MSGVLIAGSVLRADAATVALVAANDIAGGPFEIGFTAPSIRLTSVSVTVEQRLARDTSRRVNERVQVTVAGGTYLVALNIVKAARNALTDQVGAFFGFPNVSILSAGEGPDFYIDEATLFLKSLDFRVSYTEPTA